MNCAWTFCPNQPATISIIDKGVPRGPFCHEHAVMLSKIKADREAEENGTYFQGGRL